MSMTINTQQEALYKINFYNQCTALSEDHRSKLMANAALQAKFANDWEKANFIAEVCKIADGYTGRIAEVCDRWIDEINCQSIL